MNHLKGDCNLGNNVEDYMMIICHKCGAEFVQMEALMDHIKKYHNTAYYDFRVIVKCRHCQELFNGVPAMHTHLLRCNCLPRTVCIMNFENEEEIEWENEDMNIPTAEHASGALKRRREPLFDCSTPPDKRINELSSVESDHFIRKIAAEASYEVKKWSLKSTEFVNEFTTNCAVLKDLIGNDNCSNDCSNDDNSKLEQSCHISEDTNQSEEPPNNEMKNNNNIELVEFSDKDLEEVCEIILEELNNEKAQKIKNPTHPVNEKDNKLNDSPMQHWFTVSNDEIQNLSIKELFNSPDNICSSENIVSQCFDSSSSHDVFLEIEKTLGNSPILELENNGNKMEEEVCGIIIEEMEQVQVAQNRDNEAIHSPIVKQLNLEQPKVEIKLKNNSCKKLLKLLKEFIVYICPVCGEDIGKLGMWQNHVIAGHNFKKCVINNFVTPDHTSYESEYLCLKCSKFLSTDLAPHVLPRHFLKHVAFKSYIRCTLCNQTKSTIDKICSHFVCHHRQEVHEVILRAVEGGGA